MKDHRLVPLCQAEGENYNYFFSVSSAVRVLSLWNLASPKHWVKKTTVLLPRWETRQNFFLVKEQSAWQTKHKWNSLTSLSNRGLNKFALHYISCWFFINYWRFCLSLTMLKRKTYAEETYLLPGLGDVLVITRTCFTNLL